MKKVEMYPYVNENKTKIQKNEKRSENVENKHTNRSGVIVNENEHTLYGYALIYTHSTSISSCAIYHSNR